MAKVVWLLRAELHHMIKIVLCHLIGLHLVCSSLSLFSHSAFESRQASDLASTLIVFRSRLC